MNVDIRPASPKDCKSICLLIKELADFEGFGERPLIDEATLIEDGFGDSPYFHCFVAEVSNSDEPDVKLIVGYCLYFFIYSTWEGKSVYMEDLFVKPEYRNKGIGLKLWRKLAQEAEVKKCKRLDFAVLNWNEKSIQFYEKVGAINQTKQEGWNLFRLTGDALKNLSKD